MHACMHVFQGRASIIVDADRHMMVHFVNSGKYACKYGCAWRICMYSVIIMCLQMCCQTGPQLILWVHRRQMGKTRTYVQPVCQTVSWFLLYRSITQCPHCPQLGSRPSNYTHILAHFGLQTIILPYRVHTVHIHPHFYLFWKAWSMGNRALF
jgi:hypothetical protein